MFARSSLLALALAVGAAGGAWADFITISSRITSTSFFEEPPGDGGSLRFGMTSYSPGGVNIDPFTSLFDLTDYVNISSRPPTDPNDTLHNGTLTYGLIVQVNNADENETSTIDLGGNGNGGVRSNSGTFIEDFFSVSLYGQPVASFTNDVGFSLRYRSGRFLNVRMFNPNPDFDEFNPSDGLDMEFNLSDTAQFSNVFDASGPQATPEPASLTLAGIGGLVLGMYGCRTRRRNLQAAT